jgi:hypothetical protein
LWATWFEFTQNGFYCPASPLPPDSVQEGAVALQLLRKHVIQYTQYLSILIHIYPMSQLVPCPATAAKERFFPSSHASDFKAQVWHLGVEVRGVACNRFNRFRFANMSRAMQGQLATAGNSWQQLATAGNSRTFTE